MATEATTTRMEKLRDEELVLIASSDERDGFEDRVVEAARAEIARRGLSTSYIDDLRYEATEMRTTEDEKAYESLGSFGRILFFIFAPFLLTWLATGILKHQGYDQKFRDAWRFILYGFGALAGIAMLFAIADLAGK
jgi:hypothetical protein